MIFRKTQGLFILLNLLLFLQSPNFSGSNSTAFSFHKGEVFPFIFKQKLFNRKEIGANIQTFGSFPDNQTTKNYIIVSNGYFIFIFSNFMTVRKNTTVKSTFSITVRKKESTFFITVRKKYYSEIHILQFHNG